jgi:hypothetical protein
MGTSVKDLEYLLQRVLGCERDETRDHIYYTLRVNGRTVARTKCSHSWRGNKQLSDSMLSKIAGQMQCSNKTWRAFLLGNATKEDYFKELLEKGHITQEEFNSLCENK